MLLFNIYGLFAQNNPYMVNTQQEQSGYMDYKLKEDKKNNEAKEKVDNETYFYINFFNYLADPNPEIGVVYKNFDLSFSYGKDITGSSSTGWYEEYTKYTTFALN